MLNVSNISFPSLRRHPVATKKVDVACKPPVQGREVASLEPSALNYKANFMPVSFCARKLHDVHVVDRANKRLKKAEIIKLDFKDGEDRALVDGIKNSWGDSDFTYSLASAFYDQEGEFHAVRLKDKAPNDPEGVVSWVYLDEEENEDALSIEVLQSAPQIADNKQSAIRGAGELAVYSAVKLAEEKGHKKVKLSSINNGFYDKIGFDCTYVSYDPTSRFLHRYGQGDLIVTSGRYELRQEKFKEFIKRVEEKYNIPAA